MSKYFELMQQTEQKSDFASFDVPDLAPPPKSHSDTIPKSHSDSVPKSYSDDVAPKSVPAAAPLHSRWADSLAREEFVKLVQNTFLLPASQSPRVVVFAGIDPGSGCSVNCALVAEILASQNVGSVCLVDANLRKPALPQLFGVTNHFGLTEALSNSGPIRGFAKTLGPENLWLLSCGSFGHDSPNLLNSDATKARIAELRSEFDYVLIDSPPLNAFSDAIVLACLADGLVLVIEAHATRREAAARVADNLRSAQIKVLGAVLNKRTFPIPEYLYHRL